MGARVRCLTPELGVMAGYAVTATCDSMTPGQPRRREPFMALWETLAAAPKPAVLVFQDVSPAAAHSVHLGDVMATIGARLGAVGLVTDGAVRDVEGIRPLRFHLFALGVAPSHGTFNVVDVGVPVTVDGVRIAPGDLDPCRHERGHHGPARDRRPRLRAVPEGPRARARAPRVRGRQGLQPRRPARARPRPSVLALGSRGQARRAGGHRDRRRQRHRPRDRAHARGRGRRRRARRAAAGTPGRGRRRDRPGRRPRRRAARSTSEVRSRPSPSPAWTVGHHGRVDVLVNNAGSSRAASATSGGSAWRSGSACSPST